MHLIFKSSLPWGTCAIQVSASGIFPLGERRAAEQDVARIELCGALLRPYVACVCHKMRVMSGDPKPCFFPHGLGEKNKTKHLDMLVRSILFAVGMQPAARGLKHGLKHLKKHSSVNFQQSFEIKTY